MFQPSFEMPWLRASSRDRYATLAVFLASMCWLGALAWVRPLALPDEGRYVGVAWEMLSSGDWITPTLDGLPFLHKPPLFYWITAGAMQLFGLGDWVARTAPILAGSAMLAILYATLRRWVSETPARMSVVVLATQPLFYGGSQFANMDMLVACCISVAILFSACAAFEFEAGRNRRGDLTRAYIAIALGVLSKGLIGLVIPVLTMALWLCLRRRFRTMWSLVWLPGLSMFAVIVAPWFIAVQVAHPGFFHYFFVVQHIKRFAGVGFNNVQPLWFYLPVLMVLTLPWSGWVLANLRQSKAEQCAGLPIWSLLWVWFGVVVAFFSVPQSKLVGYVLPALAPLAVIVGLAAAPLIARSTKATTLWHVNVGLAAVICVCVAVGFGLIYPKTSRPFAMAILAQHDHGGVAFIDEYRYDMPFYLHDPSPVRVLSNWNAAEVQQHDNWRKEIADAGSFAPNVAATRLVDESGFHAALCSGQIRWVIAPADSADRYPFLTFAQHVATYRASSLWRTDTLSTVLASRLGCENSTPMALSTDH